MRKGAVVLLMLAAGCGTVLEPDAERTIGVIVGHSKTDPRIVLPDTVLQGASFTVAVTTYGGGCERQGETELTLSGNTATLTPYDYRDLGKGACPDIIRVFTHEATLRFTTAGTGRVVVRGRAMPSGEVVTVEREVVVAAPAELFAP